MSGHAVKNRTKAKPLVWGCDPRLLELSLPWRWIASKDAMDDVPTWVGVFLGIGPPKRVVFPLVSL